MAIIFYETGSGRAPAREFLHILSDELRQEVIALISELELGAMLSMPVSRSLSGVFKGLYELRLKDESGIYRIFYFFHKNDVHILHGFKKKTERTPFKELQIAVRRAKEIKHAF